MRDFLEEHLEAILEGIIIILVIAIIVIVIFDIKIPRKEEEKQVNEVAVATNEKEIESEKVLEIEQDVKYYVDIKGAVKKPGVYEVNKDMIINDVITLAGGLKSNASTKYLNLSKKVSNEMVINIFTTTEVKDLNITKSEECKTSSEDISSCAAACVVESGANGTLDGEQESSSSTNNDETKKPETSNGKVNINTATIDELMNVSGIGESKAKAILEYRNTNGNFKSIEDIKNVSGIGDALYEKIKDAITI